MPSLLAGSRPLGSRGAAFVCDSCLGRWQLAARTTQPRRWVASRALRENHTAPRRTLAQPTTSGYFPSRNAVSRSYSNATTRNPPSEPAQKGVVPLSHRRLVRIGGKDTTKFLQGLITNNVEVAKANGESFYAAFLDARGRVLWDVFIWVPKSDPGRQEAEESWECWIEVDQNEVQSLQKHLKRHKLRSKISIDVLPEAETHLYASWGFGKERRSATLGLSLTDPRASGFGERFFFGSRPEDLESEVLDTEQYHLRRYLFGIAEGQKEITRESALPMECNIDLASGIDFRKGCYVGQELTIRTKHTGVVRKRILPVQLYTAGEEKPKDDNLAHYNNNTSITNLAIEPGTDIKSLSEDGEIKKGRAAGKFIAAIGNVGLALCRLEMMTPMRVSAEGGTWKPGMEFGVAGHRYEVDAIRGSEEIVRVRPVVRDDFVLRERIWWEKGRQKSMQSQ